MKTIAIFDDLEHNKEDYHNLLMESSGSNKITIILLNSYYENDKKKIYSIYSLLEKKKNYFRAKLLKELSNIGKIKYKKKKIENYFNIDNFNFWEFSVFRELISYGNSNSIFLLKVIVLDNFLKNKKIQILNYSSDRLFENIIKQYCLKKNYLLISKNKNKKYLDNKLSNYLPNFVKFIIYFIYIKIFHLRLSRPKQTNASIAFFDIFTHIDFKLLKKKKFKTGYWENLPSLLKNFSLNIDWHHLFYRQNETKFPKNAVAYSNRISSETNNHKIIDIVTFKDLFFIFKKYCQLYKKTSQIDIFLKKYYENKNINIYNIFKSDYLNFLTGWRSIKNILYFRCLDNALNKKKKYKLGIYIYENQNWEKILNYFWNKYNHKNLFAIPHNEIRYWDLRYFDLYPTSFYEKKLKPKNFLINSYPSENIAKLHNFKNQIKAESIRMINFKHKFSKIKNKKMNIFVALDFFETSSRKLISILDKNVDKFNHIGKIYIKKHPASCDDYYFTSNKIHLYDNSIKNILPKIDLFIGSNSTTAIYYATFNRVPYITYIDNIYINLSHLYPKKISYFYDDYSFFQAIKNSTFDKNFQNTYYVHSDINLKKWNLFFNKFSN
jgi:surface carbohydrate biosynthesis protein (TIGR04326 family)